LLARTFIAKSLWSVATNFQGLLVEHMQPLLVVNMDKTADMAGAASILSAFRQDTRNALKTLWERDPTHGGWLDEVEVRARRCHFLDKTCACSTSGGGLAVLSILDRPVR